MRRNSWLTENWLVSQEGLCSVEYGVWSKPNFQCFDILLPLFSSAELHFALIISALTVVYTQPLVAFGAPGTTPLRRCSARVLHLLRLFAAAGRCWRRICVQTCTGSQWHCLLGSDFEDQATDLFKITHPLARLRHVAMLTLILLMWRIGWARNNASKWQIGFNSAFKELKCIKV